MDKTPEQRKYVRIIMPYITRFRVKPFDGGALITGMGSIRLI